VLKRLDTFTMSFKELKDDEMEMVEEAKSLLESALTITVNKSMKPSIVVCDCEYLVSAVVVFCPVIYFIFIFIFY
jgi:hypothetical protein